MRASQTVGEATHSGVVYLKTATLLLSGLDTQKRTEHKLLSENHLSKSINSPTPSLSAEQLMGNALLHIRDYYRADGCLVVMKMPDDSYSIFKVEKSNKKPILGNSLDESIAVHLLAIPPQHSIFYTAQAEWCIPYQIVDKSKEQLFETTSNSGGAISHLLEVDSFASVPLHLNDQYHEQYIGRLYLTNCSQYFDVAEMFFLQKMVKQITPQINHINWQHNIATNATSAMCQKISIDLHDSTIQPYIGLKLGLEALRRKIPHGDAIAAEVDELLNMTTESIAELRQYVGGLRLQHESQIKAQIGTPLVPSILEVAKKYQHRHGIEVAVNVGPALKVSERLATEIYQLVCEGLSNVLRHTFASQAAINLYHEKDQLIVEVVNYDDSTQDFIHFKPRSMTERVAYLGGSVSVNRTAGDKTAGSKTIVTAEIPLQTKDRRHACFT